MVASTPTVSIVPEGTLAYGIQLPVQALSVRTSMPWEREGATVEDMVNVARACDDAGFLYVAVCHHVAIPREPAEMMSTTWFDPVPTLAYLAARTARTRLMTNVYVAAYQHPLQTAKAFATIDTLSGGRVILGVGAGHVEGEFDALGVPFHERGRMSDEYIEAIIELWTQKEPTFKGRYVSFSDVAFEPKPFQKPHLPIWMGGDADAVLKRIARFATGW